MAEFTIQRIGRSLAEIRIEGTAPLIMNKFSEKARQSTAMARRGAVTGVEQWTGSAALDGKRSARRAKDGNAAACCGRSMNRPRRRSRRDWAD